MAKAFLAGIIVYFSVPILERVFRANLQVNYAGRGIPTSVGFVFVSISFLFLLLQVEQNFRFALLLLFFAFLGLIDDFLGSNIVKGFKGHFFGGQISTGFLKAVLGIIFALLLSSTFSKGLGNVLVNGILIAAGANFINLLDSAPGRACKAFLVLALPFLLFGPANNPLLTLFGSVLGFFPWDLRENVMMGDTGSNPLGACLGFAVATQLPLFPRVAAALFLIVANLVAEKISFSRVIEENKFLSRLDQWGR